MLSFVHIFDVPDDHSLVLIKHFADTDTRREEWVHEQRDPEGRLVARYVSWEDPANEASGYCKYEADGALAGRSDHLPM